MYIFFQGSYSFSATLFWNLFRTFEIRTSVDYAHSSYLFFCNTSFCILWEFPPHNLVYFVTVLSLCHWISRLSRNFQDLPKITHFPGKSWKLPEQNSSTFQDFKELYVNPVLDTYLVCKNVSQTLLIMPVTDSLKEHEQDIFVDNVDAKIINKNKNLYLSVRGFSTAVLTVDTVNEQTNNLL